MNGLNNDDYVHLSNVPYFGNRVWARVFNTLCTPGYTVVGRDGIDVSFRAKIKTELLIKLEPPKFKIGDLVYRQDLWKKEFDRSRIFTITDFDITPYQGWFFSGESDTGQFRFDESRIIFADKESV